MQTLLAQSELSETGRVIVALISGGALTGVGAWVLNVIVERRRSKVVATSDSIKRDRARLNLDQDKYDKALENQQRVYDDIYAKYLDLHRRTDALQDLLLKSEIERAVAVTRLSECQRQATELAKRVEHLESRLGHAE